MIKENLADRKYTKILAKLILKLLRWQVSHEVPQSSKFVLIAAPHTSNWDLPLMLLVSMAGGIHLNWIAKDSLFKGLFGRYLKWLGGIPVNRRERTNFTEQVVEILKKSTKMIIVIAPEGTRSRTEKWRSGFYYIAKGAKIPIAMGFLDYKNKLGGIGPSFYPTDNIEEDLNLIRTFYSNIIGKKAEKMSPVKF